MPKMSITHSTGSMMAAAVKGEITIDSIGVDTPPAPPPSPALEIPVSSTAVTPRIQNQGSAMSAKLAYFLRPNFPISVALAMVFPFTM